MTVISPDEAKVPNTTPKIEQELVLEQLNSSENHENLQMILEKDTKYQKNRENHMKTFTKEHESNTESYKFTTEIDGEGNDDDVTCDLQEEESCDLSLLENLQSVLVMKQFNEKYSQQKLSIPDGSDVQKTSSDRHSQAITSENTLDGATERDIYNGSKSSIQSDTSKRFSTNESSRHLQTPNSTDKHQEHESKFIAPEPLLNTKDLNQQTTHTCTNKAKENTPGVKNSNAIATPYRQSGLSNGAVVVRPLISNTPASINPHFGFSNGMMLLNNGSMSYFATPSGQGYSIDLRNATRSTFPISYNPGSTLSSMLSIPHMRSLQNSSIPCMMIYPMYFGSQQHLTLTSSQYNDINNANGMQQQSQITNSGVKSSSMSCFNNSSSTTTSKSFLTPSPSVYSLTNSTSSCNIIEPTSRCERSSVTEATIPKQSPRSSASTYINSSTTSVAVCTTTSFAATHLAHDIHPSSSGCNVPFSTSSESSLVSSATCASTVSTLLTPSVQTPSSFSICNSSPFTSVKPSPISTTISPCERFAVSSHDSSVNPACLSAKGVATPKPLSPRTEHNFKTPKQKPPNRGKTINWSCMYKRESFSVCNYLCNRVCWLIN